MLIIFGFLSLVHKLIWLIFEEAPEITEIGDKIFHFIFNGYIEGFLLSIFGAVFFFYLMEVRDNFITLKRIKNFTKDQIKRLLFLENIEVSFETVKNLDIKLEDYTRVIYTSKVLEVLNIRNIFSYSENEELMKRKILLEEVTARVDKELLPKTKLYNFIDNHIFKFHNFNEQALLELETKLSNCNEDWKNKQIRLELSKEYKEKQNSNQEVVARIFRAHFLELIYFELELLEELEKFTFLKIVKHILTGKLH